MSTPEKLYGITGWPLGHSLSPMLHNWAFKQTGFSGVYMMWPTPPDNLAAFFSAVRTLPVHGGNITIPHKVEAIKFMDKVSDRAALIGAVNTFYWSGGKLCGENTDVTGFIKPILHRKFKSALVLGAGGASRAVVAGLKELDTAEIFITNRTPLKAAALAQEFGATALPWNERTKIQPELIINCTSLGMAGHSAGETPFPKDGFKDKGLAYDIVYTPSRTRFLQEAADAGWDVQGGLDMFAGQAAEAFRLWTGKEMPESGAVRLIQDALAKN